MEKKALIGGIAFTLVGLGGRLVPHVVTGISIASIAQALGLLLVLFVIVRKRAAIGTWSRRRPAGRSIAVAVGVLILLLAAELGGAIVREIEAGARYARIEKDLVRDDPDAAEALAIHLAGVEDAPLAKRIISRIEALGVRSRIVSSTLREILRTTEDAGIARAAGVALGKLIPREEVLTAIVELPHLKPETRSRFVTVLKEHTGQSFGGDAAAWRRWFTETWDGADGDDAYALALDAYRAFPGMGAAREACLGRLSDGVGVSGAKILSLLENTDALLRLAAARAAAGKQDPGLAGALLNRLTIESDPATAEAMAGALSKSDEEGSLRPLIEVVRTTREDAARAAAAGELAKRLGGPPSTDPADLLYRLRRRVGPGASRGKLLADLVRLASDSDTAKAHLLSIARDREEAPRDRRVALSGVLSAGGDLITDEELVGLMSDSDDVEFKETLRYELRRRTGEDGGRDAAAWRKIVGGE